MKRYASLVVLACLLASTALTQSNPKDAEGHAWWQHAVFYEIYPRSFADSNNDGTGDLNGITAKLDYLQSLGVDAIWITPCFPSPQVDFGYDVSDYENIDPQYGTLEDFDRLASEAKKRNIRIILDFVINHTSDQHKWFLESKSSKENPRRDWYVWRDGKGPNQPPNNWTSTFGGSAWQWDPATKQFYYHYFYVQQPDLNWRNPEVEKAMFDVTRFWYKRGVAGFRLDAVDTLFEDPQLRDNPLEKGKNEFGDPIENEIRNKNLPEVHDVLRRLRKVADESDAVLIGETWTDDIQQLRTYYGPNHDELQMPMDFLFTTVNKLSAPDFRKRIGEVEASGGWPVYVLSNHDIVRSYVRYGDGKNNDQIAKLMAAMYLTLRGSPIMYYGEEIGMTNNNPTRREDVKDPIGKRGWPKQKGRDGERTPMQWDTSANAGFSSATPWLPVPASFKTYNVASESADENSILSWYKQLIKLHHDDAALREGSYTPFNENDPNVLSYVRRYGNEAVIVALNMSKAKQKITLGLAANGVAQPQTVLSTIGVSAPVNDQLTLPPLGVYIGRIGMGGAAQ